MTYPRTYPTTDGDGHCDEQDWNAMVNQWRGYSASGTFIQPHTYTISKTGSDYYVTNGHQTVYGGSGSTDAAAILTQLNTDCSHGDTLIIKDPITLTSGVTITKALNISALNCTKPNIIYDVAGADEDLLTLNITDVGYQFAQLENLNIDGANTCRTGIIVASVMVLYTRNLRLKRCTHHGMRWNADGYLWGNSIYIDVCYKEGLYLPNLNQIHVGDLYIMNCGAHTPADECSSVYAASLDGWIGRIVCAGSGAAYSGPTLYGFYLKGCNVLKIGQVHIEDTLKHGFIVGANAGSTITNLDIGQLLIMNCARDSTGTDIAPAVFNAGYINIGSIFENYSAAYLPRPYTAPLQAFGVVNLQIGQIYSTHTGVYFYRDTSANNGRVRVHGWPFKVALPFSGLGDTSTITHGMTIHTPNVITLTATAPIPTILGYDTVGTATFKLRAHDAAGDAVVAGVSGSYTAEYVP